MHLPLQDYLESLHKDFRCFSAGEVATYIPELAKADPEWFGICVVTTDGFVYSVGECAQPFTIQSISKPFVYALALADRGSGFVQSKVGVEPTGDAFNSISLHPSTGAPLNPMINAGAIATTSLVGGDSPEEQWRRIVAFMSACAGRPLNMDEGVYRSESETGFRNRAIGWMLRNFSILEEEPTPVLENYFRQCSISVTCRDLGVMAATLANGGVHPVTGQRVLGGGHVKSVLSVMSTCGMYDYAGSWLYEVGLPAKSGVAGGILAVLPGRFGIGVFSPRLDEIGNSVRGIQVCRRLSGDFGLHLFNANHSTSVVVRQVFSAADAPSKRVRSRRLSEFLKARASRIRIFSLQGEISLDDAELVSRAIAGQLEETDYFVLDMQRVNQLNQSAASLLHDLRLKLADRGKILVYARMRGNADVEAPLKQTLTAGKGGLLSFEDNDLAVEWCENQLIEKESAGTGTERIEALHEFPLFSGMQPAELAEIQASLKLESYRAGDVIVSMDEESDGRVFLLLSGEVSVILPLADGGHKRLATLSAGSTFGELALIEATRRTASVHADSDVELWTIGTAELDRVATHYPGIKIRLLENLSCDLAVKLKQANQLIGVLAR